MGKNRIKIISILLIALSIILMGANTYAHSGKTDSSGGHKDSKNKSGLGSYHYHCGEHPAHLHTNGVCPYSSSSLSGKSSTSSASSSKSSSSTSSSTSSSSSKKTTTTVPDTIDVTGIQINESINSIEVGENKKLAAIITPENATDKNITWKSSNESIATISASGEIIAKKSGTVDITATSSNGKTSTIKVNINQEPKVEENSATMKISTTIKNNTTDNTIMNNKKDSNPLGVILTLGLLGGGGYWGYKKYKKSR